MGSIISSPLPGFGLSLAPIDPYMTSPVEDLQCIGDELDRAFLEEYRSLHSHRGTRLDAAQASQSPEYAKPVAIGLGIIGVNFDFCGNPIVDPMHDESRIIVADVLDDEHDSSDFDRVTVSDDEEEDEEAVRTVVISKSNSNTNGNPTQHVLEWNTPRSPRYTEFYDPSPAQEDDVYWVVPSVSYQRN